jgi:hypothetical protein
MVTLRETSQKTGYNQTYLWRLVKAGKVKAEKSGSIWLVDLDELKKRKKEIEEIFNMKSVTLMRKLQQEV